MSRNYQDKIVWITGASSGIGEALAYAFAKEGARLIISARRVDRLEQVKANCPFPEKVTIVPLDVANYYHIQSVVDPVVQQFGRIDVLVNNAGVTQRAPVNEIKMEVVENIMNVNFFGQVAMTKAILPQMLKQKSGQICIISSVMGKIGLPNAATYAASKHALQGFFDSLRGEVWRDNITVTLICPGFVKTELPIHALKADGTSLGEKGKELVRGLDASTVAQRIIKALKSNKEEVNIGRYEPIAVYVKRFFPRLFSMLAKRIR